MVKLRRISDHPRSSGVKNRFGLKEPNVWVVCPEGGKLHGHRAYIGKIRATIVSGNSHGRGRRGFARFQEGLELIRRHDHRSLTKIRRRSVEGPRSSGGLYWRTRSLRCTVSTHDDQHTERNKQTKKELSSNSGSPICREPKDRKERKKRNTTNV